MGKTCSNILFGHRTELQNNVLIRKLIEVPYDKEQEGNTNHPFNVNLRNNIQIPSTKSYYQNAIQK
jgi:hypothetical protein